MFKYNILYKIYCMTYLKYGLLLLKSIYIVSTEYVKYKLNIVTHVDAYNNVTNRLSNLNILYTKLLQWIINDTINCDDEIKKNIEKFTDNVEYHESDIDYISLINLINNNDIKLLSLTPYKSGTISIIFKGILNNKPVIIKMIRKNIENKLRESIEYFKFLGKIVSYIPYISEFNIEKIINNNCDELMIQTNFINEVDNIETFYKNFKDNENIIIPEVYKKYTVENNNVIVMDYIEGINVYSLINESEDKSKYIKLIYQFILESIFDYNIFHGDLHPGNILFIKDDTSETNKYKIGIIDYGIIAKFDSSLKQNICTFFKKLIHRKYNELFELILDNLIEQNDSIEKLDKDTKEIIINKLIIKQKEFDILSSNLKPNDIYHINNVLQEYNLTLSYKFSKLFFFISSMYSLLFILQYKIEDGLFKAAFNDYCNKNIFNYLHFVD